MHGIYNRWKNRELRNWEFEECRWIFLWSFLSEYASPDRVVGIGSPCFIMWDEFVHLVRSSVSASTSWLMIDGLIVWLIDQSIDSLIHSLIVWLIGYLINQLVDSSMDRSINWLIHSLKCWKLFFFALFQFTNQNIYRKTFQSFHIVTEGF